MAQPPPQSAQAVCSTCPAYLPAKDAAVAAARGGSMAADPRGDCKRYPAPVRKAMDDWCAEHPQRGLK